MRLTYIVGYPGVGKTTAVTAALADEGVPDVILRPFAHRLYPSGLVALGTDRVPFGGTDTLSMNVQPKVLAWLAEEEPELVLGEGDRLGTLSFLAGARERGVDVTLVLLDASPGVALDRAAARADEHETATQNVSWVQGRITKIDRLVETWRALDRPLIRLDARQRPETVAAALRDALVTSGLSSRT